MSSKIANASAKNKLPSFKKPPVNEVVCGMRFRSTDKLRIPHIGLLWEKFHNEYPKLQHAQIISTTKGEIPIGTVTGLPIPRVWFINVSDDQLIQFQSDRFYFTWRKRESDYPRFYHVINNFDTVLTAVRDLFKDFDLGELEPIEYELSYINHIPQGMGWETIDDLPEIFSDFLRNKSTTRFLPNPERINWVAEFSFPE